jgi:hypothetical protein
MVVRDDNGNILDINHVSATNRIRRATVRRKQIFMSWVIRAGGRGGQRGKLAGISLESRGKAIWKFVDSREEASREVWGFPARCLAGSMTSPGVASELVLLWNQNDEESNVRIQLELWVVRNSFK